MASRTGHDPRVSIDAHHARGAPARSYDSPQRPGIHRARRAGVALSVDGARGRAGRRRHGHATRDGRSWPPRIKPMASINGRVVTLPAPVARVGRRLFVPIDFIPRALAPIYDSPIDLRRASRLLIVGTIRVARVVVRIDAAGPPTRATIEVTPALARQRGIRCGTRPDSHRGRCARRRRRRPQPPD